MDNVKIYKIIAKSKLIYIYNYGGVQYIGNGFAAYSMNGMPELDAENVLPLIGVDNSTKATYNVIESEMPYGEVLSDDAAMGDGTLIPTALVLGEKIMLRGEGSNAPPCVFCNYKALKPFLEDSQIHFIYREVSPGIWWIIAKYGIITEGIICPCSFDESDEPLLNDLELAVAEMISAISRSKGDDEPTVYQLEFNG